MVRMKGLSRQKSVKRVKRLSRRARFDDVLNRVEDAMFDITGLKDELENWLDNMPENLQDSAKADMLQEAIDALEEVESALEDVQSINVEFPRMFG